MLTDSDVPEQECVAGLQTVEPRHAGLDRISTLDDADVVAALAGGFVFAPDKILEILGRHLPLPEGNDAFIYQVSELLVDVFTPEALSAGRAAILAELNDDVIDPLAETLAVFEGDPFITRLYTTLSPEDMTLDPIFDFNPDLADQSLERRAKMHLQCTSGGTRWTVTLGKGTGRDGERVIEGSGLPPGFTPPVIAQDAVWRSETVGATGQPNVVVQKQFAVAQVIGDDDGGGSILCGNGTGLCGTGILGVLGMIMVGLRLMRRRRV